MSRYILSINDEVCVYSDTSDSPITYFTDPETMIRRLKYDYQVHPPLTGEDDTYEAIVRDAVKHGVWPTHLPRETLLESNRAGPNEECYGKDEIYQYWNLENRPASRLAERLLNVAADKNMVGDKMKFAASQVFVENDPYLEVGFVASRLDEHILAQDRIGILRDHIRTTDGMHLLHDAGYCLAVGHEGNDEDLEVDEVKSAYFKNAVAL